MSRPRLLPLVLTGSILFAGCAKRIIDVTPADIPRLEQALEARPGNPEILTQLGIAQYKARGYAQAEAYLNQAAETGEATGAAFLYLGLAREDQENWEGAREAYTSYIERGRYDPLKQEIERRLTLMVRQELRAQAEDALARESELSGQAPAPGSVAVFPFQVSAASEELMPLQVALADMMTTDLALSRALTVLERTQVQSLLTEMALTEAGFTEPETGARAGRMLRAEHVVQGALTSLTEDNLRFDTDVLNTARRQSAGEATAENLLEQLFDMEKDAVFQVLDILGVELTPAEREAINDNRAENILAFLAYGQGLMAMDQGDFAQAQQFFGQAAQLDPGFGAAQTGQTQAGALQEAVTTSTGNVESRANPELGPPAIGAVLDAGLSTTGTTSTTSTILDSTSEEVVPSPAGMLVDLGAASSGTDDQANNREPAQESKGQEGVTAPTTAQIRITIRRPGGGD
ncbi:CsgG/HfaB family protein [Gemmatimonadota bacterium]